MILYKPNGFKNLFSRGGSNKRHTISLMERRVYKILCSETKEKCEEKTENYPKELRVIKIKC